MRKLALLLPLALASASCSTFTWQGQGAGLSEDQRERGIKDIAALTREYETESFWSSVRQRRDGRINAFGRGFSDITDTIDRHLFNYSALDPAVNYPTEANTLTHLGRFGVMTIAR